MLLFAIYINLVNSNFFSQFIKTLQSTNSFLEARNMYITWSWRRTFFKSKFQIHVHVSTLAQIIYNEVINNYNGSHNGVWKSTYILSIFHVKKHLCVVVEFRLYVVLGNVLCMIHEEMFCAFIVWDSAYKSMHQGFIKHSEMVLSYKYRLVFTSPI